MITLPPRSRLGYRPFPGLTACWFCAALVSSMAYCAAFPEKPIRLIVAAAPGGSADALARTIQPFLTAILGQSIVIDNRAGASGIIGIELGAKSVPDGYTLLLNTSTHTTLPSLNPSLPFDLVADFAPVSLIVSQANYLVVHPSVPAQTVKDLVALARAKPNTVNFASGGTGTSPHLAGELLKLNTGIQITHIPYKGSGPAITDLLGGHVQMMFAGPLAIAQHIKAGRLRVLAVSDQKRSATFPEVPTMAEAGYPGVESGTWYGLAAPARTPKVILSKLYDAIKQAVRVPELRSRLDSQGVDIVASPPEQFAPYIVDEISKWTRVVRAAKVRAD